MKRKKIKTTAPEKRQLAQKPETAEECAEWIALAAKKRRISGDSVRVLALDFLPVHDVPPLNVAPPTNHWNDDQMETACRRLSHKIHEWGRKTQTQWCNDVQTLFANDPVAKRIEKMNQECQHQFDQLKKIYNILTDPSMPPLRINMEPALIITMTLKLHHHTHQLQIQHLLNGSCNPFSLAKLKKLMLLDTYAKKPDIATLGASGLRSGSIVFNEYMDGSLCPPSVWITANQLSEAARERLIITHPPRLEQAKQQIAPVLEDLKDLAQIVLQFLLPFHLYV